MADATPARQEQDAPPDYAAEATVLAPLYALFRAIAQRLDAEDSRREDEPGK